MSYEMRRKDREVTSPDLLWKMINQGLVTHLALLDAEGKLYSTCLHYGVDREHNRLYFHGAMKGRKAEAFAREPEVAFQIVAATEMAPNPRPDRVGYYMGIYASVMGTGKIRVVTDLTEKRKAIDLMHTRYKDVADYYSIKDETLDKVVNVHALEIAELTGKIKGYYNPDKPNARFMIVQDW